VSGRYDLERAERDSAEAREQLTATLVRIQKRFNPQTLMLEAGREMRQWGMDLVNEGVDTARRNPGTAITIAAASIAWLLRKPIAQRLLRLLGFGEETQIDHDELIAKAISAAAGRAPKEAARSPTDDRQNRIRKARAPRQGRRKAGAGQDDGSGGNSAGA
jgi:hypothetical protein